VTDAAGRQEMRNRVMALSAAMFRVEHFLRHILTRVPCPGTRVDADLSRVRGSRAPGKHHHSVTSRRAILPLSVESGCSRWCFTIR
jgi:hypothetical protein